MMPTGGSPIRLLDAAVAQVESSRGRSGGRGLEHTIDAPLIVVVVVVVVTYGVLRCYREREVGSVNGYG